VWDKEQKQQFLLLIWTFINVTIELFSSSEFTTPFSLELNSTNLTNIEIYLLFEISASIY